MSSRFVRGWKVDPKELLKLVGTKKVTAKKVLDSKANARTNKDVFMTLGQGYDKESTAEGKAMASLALKNLLEGKLDGGDEYGRVIELVLNHSAKPMKGEIYLGYTYHTPSDDQGCWNPMLRAMKLKTLAKLWAATNYPFPHAKGPSDNDWPVWTIFDPKALVAIAAELAPLTRKSLDVIPDKLFDDGVAVETRDELWDGLTRLRGWIAEAQKAPAQSLVLSMDGDQ